MSTPTTATADRAPPVHSGAPREVPWPLVAAAAAVLARLPFVARPLSPDEGGFLMVAAQWRPGSSLYGDYWVDRPPLLITLFQLAGPGGGAGLRALGLLATVASVLLAGRLCALAAPGRRRAPAYGAATAALLLASPLLGSYEVSGELLALPFVLLSAVAALEGVAAGAPRTAVRWWLLAGAASTAAAAVKQDFLDGFLVALVCLPSAAGASGGRRTGAALLAVLAGALGCAAVLLGWAAAHGTTPAGLWDAVVTFRGRASEVIAANTPASALERGRRLVDDWLGTGSPLVLLLALVPGRRARGGEPAGLLAVLTVVLLAWELLGVIAGGSYWRHYLVGTVPATVLAVALLHRARPQRVRALDVVLTAAAVVTAGAIVGTLTGPRALDDEVAVERYLAAHASPADTGVVAYGDAEILYGSGLPSPYPELWSLPVRVRDPHLTVLTAVLEGPAAPVWVVADREDGLAGWGIDPASARPVLARDYRPVATIGDWVVYHRR